MSDLEKKIKRENKEKLNLKNLIAMTLADIDIFLLQNEEQTADNDKEHFTREEIRDQLKRSGAKMLNTLTRVQIDIEEPLKPKVL